VLTQVVAATAKGTRAGRHEAELAVTRASGQPRLAVVPAPLGTLGSFPVILADPPWRYTPAEVTRRVENHYPTMSLDDIKALDVPAADDAVLFLWANSALLPEAIDVMGAWGFQYKTYAIWTKDKIGMGYYFRQQHELLLLGTRGQLPAPEPANRPSSLIAAPRLGHSAKPVEAYEAIEQMYPSHRKVELFARQPRTGWVAWGNETTAAL
jgi:N6-adenosine-specific RNA methylase IME4